MVYAGRLAKVHVAGTPIAFTAEATTTSDNLTFQITDNAKRIWDWETAVAVKVDAVSVTTGFSINKLEGKVVFDTAETGILTVSGKYVPTSLAAEAFEYSLSMESENLDNTRFLDEYKKRTQGLRSASGSISQWVTIDTYFIDALIAGKPVVLELYSQASLNPFRLFAILEADEMQAAVSGEQDESVSFVSTERMII